MQCRLCHKRMQTHKDMYASGTVMASIAYAQATDGLDPMTDVGAQAVTFTKRKEWEYAPSMSVARNIFVGGRSPTCY